MTSVQVFLAESGAGAFERTFKPESRFVAAGRIEIDDESEDPYFAAELVFAICNSYPTEMHADEQYRDQVRAYRDGRHRSLSMGDVLAIGEAFFFCAPTGWDLIERCSHNLMAAFIIGNSRKETAS